MHYTFLNLSQKPYLYKTFELGIWNIQAILFLLAQSAANLWFADTVPYLMYSAPDQPFHLTLA